MDAALVIVMVVAGLAIALAGVVGFLIGRQRASSDGTAAQAELAAGRLQIESLQRDVQAQREAADQRVQEERAAAERRAAAAAQEARQRDEQTRALHEERLREERERATARVDEVRREAQAQLEQERERSEQRIAELRDDQKRLADEFDALSKKALEANSRAFLESADERFKRAQTESAAELRKREEAVGRLVTPIKESLDQVKTEVTSAEKARTVTSAELKQQILAMQESSEKLGSETRRLVNALRAPQVRGRWGESQLRRVVEAAGMLNHVDFGEQPTHATDGGDLRPDLVVHLAGSKHVVVDSKVAFTGYLEAMEATDDTVRAQRLDAHARHMKKHIDDLGAKEYWDAVSGSPEFVVMFVPAEPFLAAALDRDATLYEYAFDRNVVIATPSTLVALLRTVGHAWRQDQLAQEAQQIFEVGKELHKRLSVLGKHLATLGGRLNKTVEAYNSFSSSLDRNIVTQARRFSALQGLDDAMPDPTPVEALATPPQKEDLFEIEAGEEAEEAERD
ncbi:DNA recombination protein RmuC [Microbacterium suaedae]|uniref:DNA recombination protein RmuC n=1 Tax=Microbacterium suaedae TaxID=2067813 RepID=UPI000DA1E606|nr:DNA recombination protein RmuC [Microbacterium suaedae]